MVTLSIVGGDENATAIVDMVICEHVPPGAPGSMIKPGGDNPEDGSH